MNNLWNDLNFFKEDKNTPIKILHEQSEYLSDATQSLVYLDTQNYNKVDMEYMSDFDFGYKYILKSRVLPNYGYRILEIQHNVELFPLNFIINDDLLDGLKEKNPLITSVTSIIENENDLISVISDTLNSKNVQQTIQTLYMLSKTQIN